jgi:hypothetical protein
VGEYTLNVPAQENFTMMNNSRLTLVSRARRGNKQTRLTSAALYAYAVLAWRNSVVLACEYHNYSL